MKIITLKQPWATLIADGVKTIETRTHDRFKDLVGQTIGIHAGLTFGLLPLDIVLNNNVTNCLHPYSKDNSMPRGSIICTAFVDRAEWCKDESLSAMACCSTTNKFCLFLRDIKKFDKPIGARGYQGIWNFEI